MRYREISLGPGDIIANVMPPSGADGRAILESGTPAYHRGSQHQQQRGVSAGYLLGAVGLKLITRC